jgi:hypothetical protein
MPLILLFCIVGSFAINNSMFGIIVMGVAGVVGFFMERWGFPVAPTILGVVLGTMLEEHFFSSLIKADGNLARVLPAPDRRHAGRADDPGVGLDGAAQHARCGVAAPRGMTRGRPRKPGQRTPMRLEGGARC